MGMTTVYLASQSPRRRQLLDQLSTSMGFQVELLTPHPGENAEALEAVLPSENPKDYVQRVTGLKLQAGIARLGQRDEEAKGPNGLITAAATTTKITSERPAFSETPIVLASDTTVAVDDEILGKPIDAEDARRMLKRLSGRSHWVHTGVAVAFGSGGQQVVQALSSSKVEFAELADSWINWVIQTGEPMDKAGAYAIQGHAARMIKRVEGSPTGIMGLPLHETAELLGLALKSIQTLKD
jgi:septum formation protein